MHATEISKGIFFSIRLDSMFYMEYRLRVGTCRHITSDLLAAYEAQQGLIPGWSLYPDIDEPVAMLFLNS